MPLLVSILFFASFSILKEPVKIVWDDLADVEYKEVYEKELDCYYWRPTFGDSVLKFDNELVEIEGTYSDFGDSTAYLSNGLMVFTGCFLGGRRTKLHEIIELDIPDSLSHFNSDKAKVIGILHLNKDDIYRMPYIIDVNSIEEL